MPCDVQEGASAESQAVVEGKPGGKSGGGDLAWPQGERVAAETLELRRVLQLHPRPRRTHANQQPTNPWPIDSDAHSSERDRRRRRDDRNILTRLCRATPTAVRCQKRRRELPQQTQRAETVRFKLQYVYLSFQLWQRWPARLPIWAYPVATSYTCPMPFLS
jgi:hypothetical protein